MLNHELASGVDVWPLDKTTAQAEVKRIVELANLIPGVSYTAEEILADMKPDGRILQGKWRHSYLLTVGSRIEGFIMGYVRKAEKNEQYPVSSLYMSELAVDPGQQGNGYGERLIRMFLESGLADGSEDFTLQTNAADWNKATRGLYEKLGFTIDGTKPYENRLDVIMRANRKTVEDALHGNH
jgi:ribosomal protein S18 acetylase RimI-like enzyme